jgi:membrane protein implicated in regulation of membrane protease activity
MLTFYIIAAIVALALVVMGLFGGDHGHEADHDVHFEAHAEADASAEVHAGHEAPGGEGPWIPFLSFRFWTYGLAAFGLVGLALTFLAKVGEPLTAMLAGGTGLLSGFGAALAMRMLSKNDFDSSVRPNDMISQDGLVVVAIRPGQIGRIRLKVKGEILEVLAVSDEVQAIEAGSNAVVVAMSGDKVKVVSRESIYGSALPPETVELRTEE